MYALTMKNVVALIGSATTSSANHKLLEDIQSEVRDTFQITFYDRLKTLPHFDPELISGTYTVRNYGDAQSYPGCGWGNNHTRSTYSAYPRG